MLEFLEYFKNCLQFLHFGLMPPVAPMIKKIEQVELENWKKADEIEENLNVPGIQIDVASVSQIDEPRV